MDTFKNTFGKQINLSYHHYYVNWVENSKWLLQMTRTKGNEQQRLSVVAPTDRVKFKHDSQQSI